MSGLEKLALLLLSARPDDGDELDDALLRGVATGEPSSSLSRVAGWRPATTGSLAGDGVLPSSSMKLMSDRGRPLGWLRELRKLCKLWML